MTDALEKVIKNIIRYVEDSSRFSHGCDFKDLQKFTSLLK